MWRISVFVLASFMVSCQGVSEKDRIAEEERKEALQEIQEMELERAQLSAEVESLEQKRKQAEQKLAAQNAEAEKSKKLLENVQKQLETLDRERKECKSLLDKGVQKSPAEESIGKCVQESEFVVHGLLDTFGTSPDNSLVKIGFHVAEVLKGGYAGKKVEFDLPPSASGGVKAFDLFAKHGHNYIICFKKGAQEGKYEYCGPRIDSPEIIANGANLAKVKEDLKTAPSETKKK